MITRDSDAVDRYLRNLERALGDLPRARRKEIVDEIRSHIIEAQAENGAKEYSDSQTLVERIGDPDDIADEARERFGIKPARSGPMEIFAVILLLIGGFIFVLGWFVGLVLLWSSAVWTTRDKLIGTFLWPGGLALPAFLSALAVGPACVETNVGGEIMSTCPEPTVLGEILRLGLVAFLFLVPLATMVYLIIRLRTKSAR